MKYKVNNMPKKDVKNANTQKMIEKGQKPVFSKKGYFSINFSDFSGFLKVSLVAVAFF